MARNKVQPYIEPITELIDVVGMGKGNGIASSKRGVKMSKRVAEAGSKYGSVKVPKRNTDRGVEM